MGLSLSLYFSKSFLKRRLTNFSPVRSYLCLPPTKKSSPQLMSRSPWSPSLSSLLGLPSPSSPSPSSSSSSQIILPRNSFAAPPPPMPQCSHERSQTPHACPSVSLSLSLRHYFMFMSLLTLSLTGVRNLHDVFRELCVYKVIPSHLRPTQYVTKIHPTWPGADSLTYRHCTHLPSHSAAWHPSFPAMR